MEYRHNDADPKSLSNDLVNTIYVSREGELWIGTDGGLDLFDPRTGSFTHGFQASQGSPVASNVSVRSIFEDDQGMFWIGTQTGLVQWIGRETVSSCIGIIQCPNLSDDSVKSIYKNSQGLLWIGTLRGLNQFDFKP